MNTIQVWTIDMLDEMFIGQNIQQMKTQRIVKKERLTEISRYIMEHHMDKSFIFGIIVLSEFDTGKYNIIDGQHRLNAIHYGLSQNEKNELSKFGFTILVDVRHTLKFEDELTMFKMVNMAVSQTTRAEINKDEIYNQLSIWISKEYKERFSLSDKPIIPNMNLSILINKIKSEDIASELYESGIIDSVDDLIQCVIKLNKYLEEKFDGDKGYEFYYSHAESAGKKHSGDYFKGLLTKIKSMANPCYLGLIPKYRWIIYIGNIDRI